MKKFLLGLLAGLLLAGLACVIFFFAAIRLGDRRPTIPSDATLVLRLNGEIPERSPVEIPLPMFESQTPLTVLEIRELLWKAAADPRVKAIVFEPRGIIAGWAKLQEIRDALLHFKKSGKPLLATLSWPRSREYYLATACDKIYMSREDLLDLKGLRAELTFFRKTLDKVGIEFEAEHAGRYKDAADAFTRTSATPETREVVNSMLDGVFGHLLETIASGRKLAPDKVRALIDEGPFLASNAKAKGLIDDLYFEDQVYGEVKTRLKQTELHKLSHREYMKVSPSSVGIEGRARIAVIVGDGAITRGGGDDGFEDEGIRSLSFIQVLREVAANDSIRGVVLRVNSPGGDAVASDDILREVRLLSAKKPLVISMSDVAASGGYFISMSGDPVLAYPNTVTGSIGVIFGKLNMVGLYDKIGLSKEIFTRGRYAAIDSAAIPMDEAARNKLREGIDAVYRAFLERVAEGRKKKVEDIRPIAEGRAWLGSQAKGNGLIDELGGFDRALALVRQKAKIGADDKLRLVVYPRKRTIFEQLFGSADQSLLGAKKELGLRELSKFAGIDLRLFVPGGYLRLAPYSVTIE